MRLFPFKILLKPCVAVCGIHWIRFFLADQTFMNFGQKILNFKIRKFVFITAVCACTDGFMKVFSANPTTPE